MHFIMTMLLLHESLSYVLNNCLNAGKEGTRIRIAHGEKACKCFINKCNDVHGKFQEFIFFRENINIQIMPELKFQTKFALRMHVKTSME